LKFSERMVKVSNPGIMQVRRFYNKIENVADMLYDMQMPPGPDCTIVDPFDPTHEKLLKKSLMSEDLLIPIFREGQLVYKLPALFSSEIADAIPSSKITGAAPSRLSETLPLR